MIKNQQRGFSIIELLLVMALMAAVLGISMPYFFGVSKMESVLAAADNFSLKIKEVQTKALSNEQRYAPPGRRVLGQFISAVGFNSTSFNLGVYIDDPIPGNRWLVTKTISMPANLVLDAGAVNGSILYFKSVSGQTRYGTDVAAIFLNGTEPNPLASTINFYVHYISEILPRYEIRVEPSGRVWINSVSTLTPTLTPVPTPTPIPTIAPTPTPVLTSIPTLIPTPTLTSTPLPTNTPTPTSIPTPTLIPTPTPNPACGGLVSYWKMDETSGVNVADSFASHHGTANSGASIVSGKLGNARNFNGSGLITVPSNSAFDLSTNPSGFTIAFWVNMPSPSTLGNTDIIVRPGWWAIATSRDQAGDIRFFDTNGNGVITQSALTSGWHHVVGVGTGNVSSMKIYIDGTNVPLNKVNSWTNLGGAYDVTIGGNLNGYFSGYIDEVGIWNRTLSLTEIQSLWNGSIGRSCP